MTPRERTGRLIVLAVVAVLLGGCVVFFVWDAVQMANAVTLRRAGGLLRNVAFTGIGFTVLIAMVRRGNPAVRWVLPAATALFAAGIIGTAVWMTTLDYPNATTPEERAAMQKDDRDNLPVRILQGAFPLLVTLPLFLPHARDYLAYRRRETVGDQPPAV